MRTIAIAILLLCAACGPAAAPNNHVSFMVWGDPAEKAAYESLVAAFKQAEPNISVMLTHIPGQNDYRKRLAADFAASRPADLVLLNYRRMGTFAAKNAIQPLGPYLSVSTVIKESDFYPQAIEPFRYNGTLMCIPQNISSLVVYYNKQLFDQADVAYPKDTWTWDEFLETAKALTRDTNGDGTTDQYGVGIEPSAIRLAPFIWQQGGALVDDGQAPTRLTLDTPEALAAAQWFADLQTKHHVVPDAVQIGAEDNESRFQNGRTAMFFESRRAVPTLREIDSFDWDVAALPQGKQRASILHADAYCMSAQATNKEAAWKFVEFANSPKGQEIIAETGRTVPSLKAVSEAPVFLEPTERPKNSAVFLDIIPDLRAVPSISGWEDIEVVLDNEIQRAFYGQASVAEALKTAEQNARPFFEP